MPSKVKKQSKASTMKVNEDLKSVGVDNAILDYVTAMDARSTMSERELLEESIAESLGENIRQFQKEKEKLGRITTKENVGKVGNDSNIGATTGNAKGSARVSLSPGKKEKFYHLEKENRNLKTKGQYLTNELTKMNTKLRRISELMQYRSKIDEEDHPILDIQEDLKNECVDLKTQNKYLEETIRKLNVIQRSLAAPTTAAPKPNKYAHVQGKLSSTTKLSKRYQEEAADMRAQIQINTRKAMQLENELKAAHELSGGMGMTGADQLRQEISNMAAQIRQADTEMEKCQGQLETNMTIFKEGRNYTSEIQDKIKKQNKENEQLNQEIFKLQLKTQEVNDIAAELIQIQQEKEQTETRIKILIETPFIKREEGQGIASRIAELQTRQKAKEKEAGRLKLLETDTSEKLTTEEKALAKLKGEMEFIVSEHKKANEAWRDKHEKIGPTETDAVKGLLTTDPARYTTLMTDLRYGGGETAEPLWAKLPFLERGDIESLKNKDQKSVMLEEIDKLKHEKQVLSSELTQAESLLKLQKDIERENTKYFEEEKARLTVVERAARAKLEELSRRADDKEKTINDFQRKLDGTKSRQGSPDPYASRKPLYEDDVMTEFSRNSQESEIDQYENILDIKIENAEFYLDHFNQVPEIAQEDYDHESLLTVVTVDFYNHSTETTQMAEGAKANYQTQFSFVNQVDSFYVTFLQKNSLKMDVYVSRKNAAVHLGRCTVLLKELLEREIIGDSRTPVIKREADILPVAFSSTDKTGKPIEQARPLGFIKYKMRLRNPVSKTLQHFQQVKEIGNMHEYYSEKNLNTIRPVKKIIIITVVGCQGLKFKYSDISNVQPFFFYQFYTFEDRYSHNGVGENPVFNDTYSYEVLYDEKAKRYFRQNNLEIILFDDNAVIPGTDIGQDPRSGNIADGDDMIGSASIPLKDLATNCSIFGKYEIRAPSSTTAMGTIEVKIAVNDLEQVQQESILNVHKAAQEMNYNKEWEEDVVMRIARKLGSLHCDIELIFGIFTQGQRNCTKEDFKHCCLHRLNLRADGMTERELDLLLMGNKYTKDDNIIERDDFVNIFGNTIIQARNERQEQAAFQESVLRDESFMSLSPEKRAEISASYSAYVNDAEIYDILGEVIKNGAYYSVIQKATRRQPGQEIRSHDLRNILVHEGMIADSDAGKIVHMIEVGDQINLPKFEELLLRTRHFLINRSEALEKLKKALRNHGKLIVQKLESVDYNNDSMLNVDGFKAALRYEEVQMDDQELEEAFYLICEQGDGEPELHYHDWIISQYPKYNTYFQLHHVSRETPQPHLSQSLSAKELDDLQERSISYAHIGPVAQELDKGKVSSAKQKIEAYIQQQEVSLGVLFEVIDSDSSGSIEYHEFKSKVKGLHMGLDDQEINSLFQGLDLNGDGVITYGELVEHFSDISTRQIIARIQKIVKTNQYDKEFFFNRYSNDNQRMSKREFQKMVQEVYSKVTAIELSHVYKHFDKGSKGYISKDEFLDAFDSMAAKQTFALSIEDIIKPLQTKAIKFDVNLSKQFDKYDTDGNHRLSAEELRDALGKNNLHLTDDDVLVLKDFFRMKYKSNEIKKEDFIRMMETKFERKFESKDAKQALFDVRNKLEQMPQNPTKLLNEFNTERTELINICSFKKAMNHLKCLGQYDIDNLAKYLDTKNEGYISIAEFSAATGTAFDLRGGSFRSTQKGKGASQRTMKWNEGSGGVGGTKGADFYKSNYSNFSSYGRN